MKRESLIFSVIAVIIAALIIIFLLGARTSNDESEENFSVEIAPEGKLEAIKLREIKIEDDGINVTYTFDNSGFIGESMAVELWISDINGTEIARRQDIFSIKKDNLIERNIFFEIPGIGGEYYLYTAQFSDLNNFLKQKVVVEKKRKTKIGL